MSKWHTVAPIMPIGVFPNRVSEVGPGVWLAAIPEWFKQERKFTPKTLGHLKTIDSEACLLAEYQSSGFGEREDPANPNSHPKHEVAIDALRVALLSLWLGRPSGLTFEFTVTTEPEPSPGGTVISTKLVPGIKPRFAYASARLNAEHVKEAHVMATAIRALPRPNALWTATRFLWFALTEDVWELRFVNLWIALEAILGPEDRRDLQKRISKRLARLLNAEDREGQEAYRITFESYEWRCAAVHGSRLSGYGSDRAESLMLETEGTILSSLRKILLDDELVRVFASPNRDVYLDKLARGFHPPSS